MSLRSGRMAGMRKVVKLLFVLLALGLGVLAWDVYQLRALQPPADRTFEGFARAGKAATLLRIDDAGGRLYWLTLPPKRVLVRDTAPPVYAFDREGALVDWTPGGEPGMISGSPLYSRGRDATLETARAWLKQVQETGDRKGSP